MLISEDYLGQTFTPKEVRIVCNHRYRICDCGAIHCLGPCKFTQGKRILESENIPDKRAPCCFHGGEWV